MATLKRGEGKTKGASLAAFRNSVHGRRTPVLLTIDLGHCQNQIGHNGLKQASTARSVLSRHKGLNAASTARSVLAEISHSQIQNSPLPLFARLLPFRNHAKQLVD
jgi:hypothetical protein